MSPPYWALLPAAWVGAGVLAVVVVLYRRGHREGSWLLIGAVLGPLILPIAVERVRRGPGDWGGAWSQASRSLPGEGPAC